ncbi:hypothetical protein D3C84_966720 [compost metagenome]
MLAGGENGFDVRRIAHGVHIAVFALAGLAWHQQRQPPGDQAFQLVHDLFGVFEVMHPSAAGQ